MCRVTEMASGVGRYGNCWVGMHTAEGPMCLAQRVSLTQNPVLLACSHSGFFGQINDNCCLVAGWPSALAGVDPCLAVWSRCLSAKGLSRAQKVLRLLKRLPGLSIAEPAGNLGPSFRTSPRTQHLAVWTLYSISFYFPFRTSTNDTAAIDSYL